MTNNDVPHVECNDMTGKITRPQIMQFFEYKHLPVMLAEISRCFYLLAEDMLVKMPNNNPERDRMLIKLLEAKDCAVRAYMFKP